MTSRLLPALALLLVACPPKTPVSTAPAEIPAPVAPAPVEQPAATAVAPAAPAIPVAEPTPATPGPDASAPVEGAVGGDSRRRFEDAVAMLTTGDPGKARSAIDVLKPLAGEYPDAAVIHYNLGVAYQVSGQTADARNAWTRATMADAKFAKAWLNLAALSAREGRADQALVSLQTGLRSSPENVDLRVATIAILREMRRYDEAIQEARSALAINSKAIPIYNNLALVYLDTAQLDLARFILQKALADIEGAKGNAQLHAVLGQIFYRQGQNGDAILSFKKALELDPFQLSALQFLAQYYLDNRSYADALPLLERATAAVPRDAGIKINLGIAYRGVGRFEEARKSYEDALLLDPRNPEPHRNLAVLYGDYMKAYDAAVESVEAYRKAGGGKPEELDAWVAAIRKEQKKVEDRRKRDEERKRKEAEAAAKPPEDQPAAPQAPSGLFAPDPGTEPAGAPAPDPVVPAAPPPDPVVPAAPVVVPAAPEPATTPQPAPAEPDPWNGGGG